MGQKCCICIHDRRIEIEKEILHGLPHSKIALKYDVGMMSVRRHAQNHLSRQLVKHKETRELLHSDSLLQELNSLVDRTKAILDDSEDNKKHVISLRAIAELRNTYELFVKLALTMKEVIDKDEEENKQVVMDKLKVFTEDELELYSQLLEKMETGEPKDREILGLDWKTALQQSDIYLYQRIMEVINYEKDIRERHDAGEIFYYEEEQEKWKARIRKNVCGFEDEKKETDETAEG